MRKPLLLMTVAVAIGVTHAFAQPTNLAPFQTNVTVAVTATMNAVPANPTRKGLILCAGANPVNVSFGTVTPTATTGLAIAAGTCFSFLPYMGATVAMGAQINTIGAMASTLSVFEL